MAPKRLRNYSAAFKLQLIMKAESIGNCLSAHAFGVDERYFCQWRSKKSIIKGMLKLKKERCSGAAHWSELDANLKHWILEQHDKGLWILTVRVCMQAKNITADMEIKISEGIV